MVKRRTMDFQTRPERKDPADVAKEFLAKTSEAEKVIEKEEPKPAVEVKPEIKDTKSEDEKATQPAVEPSTTKEVVEGEDKKSDPEKVIDEKDEPVKADKDGEDKNPKRNLGAEKRINELVAELKGMREDSSLRDKEYSMRIDALEKEKNELQRKAGIAPEDKVLDEVSKLESERIRKYIEEDKSKPKEKRREMSKEEYEEWLVEDLSAATDWLVEQKLRRRDEKSRDKEDITIKSEVDRVQKSQQISRFRVEARHPEIANAVSQRAKLLAEGMSEKDIHDKLYKENVKYRVIADIMKDREVADRVMLAPDGPEQLEKEMVKRMSAKVEEPKPDDSSKIAKLEQQIAEMQEALEMEKNRTERIDVGITSKKGASMSKDNTKSNAELDKVISMLNAKGHKFTKEDYVTQKQRRSSIRGADNADEDRS